eukprot:6200742-Pleurochrysis_carterae.AAC.2
MITTSSSIISLIQFQQSSCRTGKQRQAALQLKGVLSTATVTTNIAVGLFQYSCTYFSQSQNDDSMYLISACKCTQRVQGKYDKRLSDRKNRLRFP